MLDEFLLVLGQVGQGEEVLEPGGGAHLHNEVMTMTISADLWTSVDISPPGLWYNDIMNTSDHLWPYLNIFEHLWPSLNIFERLWTSVNICSNVCEHLWTSEHILPYVPLQLANGFEVGYKKRSVHWEHQTPLRFCRIEDDDLGRKGKCSCQLSCWSPLYKWK